MGTKIRENALIRSFTKSLRAAAEPSQPERTFVDLLPLLKEGDSYWLHA